MKQAMNSIVLPLIVLACYWPAVALTDNCTESDITTQVKNIGYWPYGYNYSPTFLCLNQQPQLAAKLLIKELRLIHEEKIKPGEVGQHKQTMHVIWSLRALYYLTGIHFTTPLNTESELAQMEKKRRYFLTIMQKNRIQFFSVWMSRDIIYIAPISDQEKIIARWIDWYKKDGQRFKYVPHRNIDAWYFG